MPRLYSSPPSPLSYVCCLLLRTLSLEVWVKLRPAGGQPSFGGEEAKGLHQARWSAWRPDGGPEQAVCGAAVGQRLQMPVVFALPNRKLDSACPWVASIFLHVHWAVTSAIRLGGLPSDAQAGSVCSVTLGPAQPSPSPPGSWCRVVGKEPQATMGTAFHSASSSPHLT